MRIVRFRLSGTPGEEGRMGARLEDGSYLDASSWNPPACAHELFDLEGEFIRCLGAAVKKAEQGEGSLPVHSAEDVVVLAPVQRPGKVICVGLNYEDHALESTMALPEEPLIFSKFSTTINDPGASIRIPPGSDEVDFEAELGVVIGRRTSDSTRENALESVLGYTCVNDVSARDFQFADGQWQRGKSCDGFCPIGPEIVTTSRIPDPQGLGMQMILNDSVMQESNTGKMIFDVRTIIAHITSFATLEPGDLIATGTPPGCGFAMTPPVYLGSGDRMTVRIEGIGELHNTIE
ncbi:MAG: fumarylacetoacetate hydrolase family protein [Phycisphaerales bacterium]|nr:fumarylacetoacetate hydrolase family protein [Phycisphaerales bacterium]